MFRIQMKFGRDSSESSMGKSFICRFPEVPCGVSNRIAWENSSGEIFEHSSYVGALK
jgi:hypothetical protein